MLIKGNKIRHISSLDVDLEIVQVVYANEEYFKVKVWYLNRNYNNMVIVSKIDTVKIYRNQLDKWFVV